MLQKTKGGAFKIRFEGFMLMALPKLIEHRLFEVAECYRNMGMKAPHVIALIE